MGIVYNTSIVRDGLVLHVDAANVKSYPDTGTTWSDLSGQNNHITLQNSPTHTSGINGYFSFNGTNQYGIVDNNIESYFPDNPTYHPITVISIARISAIVSKATALAMSDGAENFFYPNSRISGSKLNYWDGAWLTGNTDYNTNTWYSFVWASDSIGTTMNFYYNDAVSDGGGSISGFDPASETGTETRIAFGNSGEYFQGDMATMMIYNRELTTDEILQNFEAMRGRYGL